MTILCTLFTFSFPTQSNFTTRRKTAPPLPFSSPPPTPSPLHTHSTYSTLTALLSLLHSFPLHFTLCSNRYSSLSYSTLLCVLTSTPFHSISLHLLCIFTSTSLPSIPPCSAFLPQPHSILFPPNTPGFLISFNISLILIFPRILPAYTSFSSVLPSYIPIYPQYNYNFFTFLISFIPSKPNLSFH